MKAAACWGTSAGPEEQEQGHRGSCQPAPRCRRLLLTGANLLCRDTAIRRFLLNYPHVWADYFIETFSGRAAWPECASWNRRACFGGSPSRPPCVPNTAARPAPRSPPSLRLPASLHPCIPPQTHGKRVGEHPQPGSALSAPKCARQHLDASI